jgi:hypothetical protein
MRARRDSLHPVVHFSLPGNPQIIAGDLAITLDLHGEFLSL